MSGILRLESLTKGNTLKQGDKTPLKYRLFDADGEKLNIAGKSAKVRLVYPDFLTIGYEKDGLTVAQDDTVTFTIDSVIPSRIYHVEIIVDEQFIFPSRADESKFTVDKSSLGAETNIIEIVGVDAVVAKVLGQVQGDIDDVVSDISQAEANRVQAEQQRQSGYEEVKQIIEDGAIDAVPADGSITTEKLAFPAVSGTPSKNLYNKDTSLLNKGIGSTGMPFDQAGYFISDFIKVEPSTFYTLNLSTQGLAVYFYKQNKEFIENLSNTPSFETPESTGYVRVRSLIENVNSTQLEKGTVSTSYVPYGNYIDSDYIVDGSITSEKLDGNIDLGKIESATFGKNLFNKNDVTQGQYILSNGSLRYDENRSLSGYIPIKPSTYYTVSEMQNMAMFDENYAHVGGFQAQDSPTFQTPDNAKYMRIGMLNTYLDTFQLEEGQNKTEYERFGYRLEALLPAESKIPEPFLKLRNAVEGVPSKNLYNKDTSLLNKGIGSTGAPFDQVGYFISDFIKVEPLTSYAINVTEQGLAVFFYDSSKIFQSNLSNTPVFETPANTNYVRFRSLIGNVDTAQLEEGEYSTSYQAYGNYIDSEIIIDGSVSSEKLAGDISLEKINGARVGKNKFNKNAVTSGQWITSAGGLRYDDNRSLSEYISIKPSTYYTLSKMQHMAIFDDTFTYLTGYTASNDPTFETPETARYMRIGIPNADIDSFQLEEGQNKTDYEPFGHIIDGLLIDNKNEKPKPFLRLRNAVEAWYAGEKFPVAFFGDSQTDGNGTTGFRGHNNVDVLDGDGTPGNVDYIAPNAYSKKLEEFIQEETDNPTARIYNAGYSGHSLNLMLGKREQLFSQAYSDTKMVGISMGTNDRNLEVDRTRLEKRFKRDLIEYVEWFYSKGIQPFILTSQASVEPDTLYESQKVNQLRNKKSEVTHAVINRIKKEVAKEYDLELIDVSKFGELFLTYSKVPATEIINDKLHFNDAGHLAQAGYIFSEMVDRVVEIDDDEILSFTNQRMRSNVAHEHTTLLDTIEDGFKVIVDYTKEDTNDMLILDFWVLNKSKSTFTLKSFIKTVQQTYVSLNGNVIPLTAIEQTLTEDLDIGLHHIQVLTGNSNIVDFKGLVLIKN